ncbi:hypothetical protein FRC14_002027 [Serendipita sp. 396]|nr:hypothetical protein FRC14_002027 [Serendipita sp. 396]KAG8799337.1 hypothetical protein FRC16_005334 [Serendipita sp. 398]KAG8837292.1 hypothetical protein FRC18_009600 [Serendipita sp. 400]KAG9056933.1 hypothetical protein FS842_009136 [Serendipita sp. 407]
MQIAFLRHRKKNLWNDLLSASRRVHTRTSTQDDLRHLMLRCAQPVAVVTTRIEGKASEPFQGENFHGATISSFSSIAMYPYPTVSFSLQLPSRLASTLRAAMPSPVEHDCGSVRPHLVINLLSSKQESLARRFSRPDIYPHPFKGLEETQVLMTSEGQPYLRDNLGSMSCSILKSIPLTLGHSLGVLDGDEGQVHSLRGSELFIARVNRIEYTGEGISHSPLIYHERTFKSVK